MEATPTRRGGALFRRSTRISAPQDRIDSALHDPLLLLLAAALDDHVAGFAIAKVRDSIGVIDELYVEPEARELGLGEELLQGVLDWCRGRQCTGVDIAVLPGDRNMKNLCERMGLKARVLVMHQQLD